MTDTNTYAVVIEEEGSCRFASEVVHDWKDTFDATCVLNFDIAVERYVNAHIDLPFGQKLPSQVKILKIILGDELPSSQLQPAVRQCVIDNRQLSEFEVAVLKA